IVGGTLSATLCAGSLVGLYMAVSYQEALNDTFTFASAIIVKGINLVIPRVQTSIVALEKIKDPRAVIRQEVMRVFFIKMCGIVFLYLSIRKMQSEAAENGQCPEFVVGFTLLQLFVIDCAGDMLITIGFAQLARMRKLAGKKEFKVSSDIINTLYRQCVSWIACLYCPMMPAISSLWTLALFFVKARCMFAVCKVPSEPVSSEESSAFYEAMLLGTLGVVTVPLFSFLNTKQQHCGPHWAGPSCTADVAACKTPLDALSDFMPDGSDSALEWVFSPLILATLAVALLSVIYLLTLTVFSKNFQIEKKMTELNSEVKDLRQLLRVATDQSQNNSPALPPAKQAAKKQPFQLRPLSPAFEDSSSVVETDEKLSASEVSTVLVGVIPGFDNELTPALLPFVDDKALRGQRKKQHVEESLPGTTAPQSS
ncbi:Transmembrane channel-like protein 1, partial [Diplonema papillatum]